MSGLGPAEGHRMKLKPLVALYGNSGCVLVHHVPGTAATGNLTRGCIRLTVTGIDSHTTHTYLDREDRDALVSALMEADLR